MTVPTYRIVGGAAVLSVMLGSALIYRWGLPEMEERNRQVRENAMETADPGVSHRTSSAPDVAFDGCIVIFPPAERPDSVWLDLTAVASFSFEPPPRYWDPFDRYVSLRLGNGGVLSLPLAESQQETFMRAWKGCRK
jgi:hypothetical protein